MANNGKYSKTGNNYDESRGQNVNSSFIPSPQKELIESVGYSDIDFEGDFNGDVGVVESVDLSKLGSKRKTIGNMRFAFDKDTNKGYNDRLYGNINGDTDISEIFKDISVASEVFAHTTKAGMQGEDRGMGKVTNADVYRTNQIETRRAIVSGKMGTNIANLIDSLMEHDMGIDDKLKQIVEADGEPNNDPQETIDAIYKTLRDIKQENNPKYKLLFKIFKETENIRNEELAYQREKSKGVHSTLESITTRKLEALLGSNISPELGNSKHMSISLYEALSNVNTNIRKADIKREIENKDTRINLNTHYQKFIIEHNDFSNFLNKENISGKSFESDMPLLNALRIEYKNSEKSEKLSNFIANRIKNGEDESLKIEQKKEFERVQNAYGYKANEFSTYLYSKLSKESTDVPLSNLREKVQGKSSKISLSNFVQEKMASIKASDKAMVPSYLSHLSQMVSDDIPKGIGDRELGEIKGKLDDYIKTVQKFPLNHTQSMDISSVAMSRLVRRTKESPTALLATLTMDEDEVNKESVNEYRLLHRTAVDSLKESINESAFEKGVTLSEEQLERMSSSLIKTLKDNKKLVSDVYNREENAQEKYDFRNFTMEDRNNDVALNVIRDVSYLAIMEETDKDLYDEVYAGKKTELLNSSIRKDLDTMRPSSRRINDISNAYILLSKTLSGEISDIDAEKIVSKEFFKKNELLDTRELQNLTSLGKEISKKSEKIREKEIFGEKEIDKLSSDIQEMNYLNYGEKISDRLDPTKLRAHFGQNNELLYRYSLCMEKSKTPTNNLETTSSMSKECSKTLIGEMRQDAEKKDKMISNVSGLASLSPFGFFLILSQIKSQADADFFEAMDGKLHSDINKEIAYVTGAKDSSEAKARFMELKIKHEGMGEDFIQTGYEGKLISQLESGGTLSEISDNATDSNLGIVEDMGNPKDGNNELKETLIEVEMSEFGTSSRQLKDKLENLLKNEKALKSRHEHFSIELEDSIARGEEPSLAVTEGISGTSRELIRLSNDINDVSLELTHVEDSKFDIADRIDKGGKINLSNMSDKQTHQMAILLGKYREKKYDEKIERMAKGEPERKHRMLNREIAKLDIIIPTIHRKMLVDNRNLALIVKKELKDEYGVELDKGIEEDIAKYGLYTEGEEGIIDRIAEIRIRHIDDLKKNNSSNELRNLSTSLNELHYAQSILNGELNEIKDTSNNGILSNYMNRLEKANPKVSKAIHNSNTFFVITTKMDNGMSKVTAGKGLDGFALEKMDKAYMKDDFIKSKEYRKFLKERESKLAHATIDEDDRIINKSGKGKGKIQTASNEKDLNTSRRHRDSKNFA